MATRRPPHSFSLYWGSIKGSVTHISENNLALVSAGIAFFVMLSLFPA
ncbi:MAG: ribonuclease BN, partial [Sulfitobacter sp.]|nr:ribonuclease BN [Sulfitobacter sp.]